MSKKLILGFALAVVLFSGPLLSVSAQADWRLSASHQLAVMLVWNLWTRLPRGEIWTGQRLLARAHITMARPYRAHLAR